MGRQSNDPLSSDISLGDDERIPRMAFSKSLGENLPLKFSCLKVYVTLTFRSFTASVVLVEAQEASSLSDLYFSAN